MKEFKKYIDQRAFKEITLINVSNQFLKFIEIDKSFYLFFSIIYYSLENNVIDKKDKEGVYIFRRWEWTPEIIQCIDKFYKTLIKEKRSL